MYKVMMFKKYNIKNDYFLTETKYMDNLNTIVRYLLAFNIKEDKNDIQKSLKKQGYYFTKNNIDRFFRIKKIEITKF